jgi:hypothetical protein
MILELSHPRRQCAVPKVGVREAITISANALDPI